MLDCCLELWNTRFKIIYTYLKNNQRMPSRGCDDHRAMANWLSMNKVMYKQGKLSEFKRGMMDILYQDFPFIGFKQ